MLYRRWSRVEPERSVNCLSFAGKTLVTLESADYQSSANFGRFLIQFIGAALGLAVLLGVGAVGLAVLLR